MPAACCSATVATVSADPPALAGAQLRPGVRGQQQRQEGHGEQPDRPGLRLEQHRTEEAQAVDPHGAGEPQPQTGRPHGGGHRAALGHGDRDRAPQVVHAEVDRRSADDDEQPGGGGALRLRDEAQDGQRSPPDSVPTPALHTRVSSGLEVTSSPTTSATAHSTNACRPAGLSPSRTSRGKPRPMTMDSAELVGSDSG